MSSSREENRHPNQDLALRSFFSLPNPALDQKLANFVEKEFDELVAKKIRLYGGDALDAVRELAVMPLSDNSYMMAVKLQAGSMLIKLMRPEDQKALGGASEGDNLLKQLNEDYRNSAPRIRQIRERIISFEEGTSPSRTIEDPDSPDHAITRP